ncbi:hypothetical protein MOBT1_002897 [Malassezia obtusa]|uniref:Uncharacterized protein n=1 Tax=Malassezia obtusa TaxID=76774 RepID=A0AAF0E363_9BASI|nr:hypothetical protein MOBT1_002897 [Malassezia obtusa]
MIGNGDGDSDESPPSHGSSDMSALAKLATGELNDLHRMEHEQSLMRQRASGAYRRPDGYADERYAHPMSEGYYYDSPHAEPMYEDRAYRYADPYMDRYRDLRYDGGGGGGGHHWPSHAPYAYRYAYSSYPGSREASPGPRDRTMDELSDTETHDEPRAPHDASPGRVAYDATPRVHPGSSYATPSGSPVLGPLRNMSLFGTAPNSPYSSRPGSPVLGARTASHGSLASLDGPSHLPGVGHHGHHRYRPHPYGPEPLHAARSRSHFHLSSLGMSSLPPSTSGERSTAGSDERRARDEHGGVLKPTSSPPHSGPPSWAPPRTYRAPHRLADLHAGVRRASHNTTRSAPSSVANSPPDSPHSSPSHMALPPPSALHLPPPVRGTEPPALKTKPRPFNMTPIHPDESSHVSLPPLGQALSSVADHDLARTHEP